MREIRWTVACLVGGLATALTSCGGGGGGGGGGSSSLVALQTTTVPSATTGVAYTTTFEAQFPHPPGVFKVVGGTLPPGLTLDLETGTLSGFPSQVGVFHFAVAARDGADEVQLGGALPTGRDATFDEDRRDYSVSVALGPPHILPQTIPAATYRASFQYPFKIAGGTAPYVWAQTGGTLPAGLSVAPTGSLGTFATQAQQPPYAFQVTVTDAQGLTDSAQLDVHVVILPLIVFTANPLPEAALGFPYALPLTLASAGGFGPYTWSQSPLAAGETSLASIGMSIQPDGRLVDTGFGPTALGTFKFTVRVTDEPGQVATRALQLKVNPGPVLTKVTPARSSQGPSFTATGANFQDGAVLIFKPGSTQTVVNTTFVNATSLTFSSPSRPSDGGGAVDVMVRNPDSGANTKAAAFIFPAATIAFGTKGFVADTLSSTGLDVADVNGDGRADIVHAGASGFTAYSGSPSSTSAGVHLLRNLGGSPPTFSSTTLDTGSFYDVKFADVNADGKPDIVALGQTQVKVWINNPLGTFSASPIVSNLPTGFSWPSEMAIGLLNSDLLPDLAFGVTHYPSSNLNGRVYTMTGNGAGSFTLADSATSTIVNTYGVISLCAADSDGDGRAEICAGVGMNPYSGPEFNYSPVTTGAFFTGWSQRGGSITSPGYGSTTAVFAGDFLGTGRPSVVVLMTGAPNYSNVRKSDLYSGPGYNTTSGLLAQSNITKCGCAIDADFDSKTDFAVSTRDSQLQVYRSSAAAFQLTLDASIGSPAVSSPRLGRVASGDLDGDGKPDLLATTSYWATEGMASNYGSSYQLGAVGNGGSMGVVFWLNSSN